MTNDEAKFILSAYRANGRDATDPAFAKALQQAASDPSLARWLEQQVASDRAIASSVQSITPPAHLRMTILAGARLEPVRRDHSWVWALAACAVLAISLSSLWPSWSNQRIAKKLGTFASIDTEPGNHGGRGSVLAACQQVLATANGLGAFSLGAQFDALASSGCRTFSLGGHSGVEICFVRPEGTFHLYMVRLDPDAESQTRLRELNGRSTLTWVSEGFAYALVSDGSASAKTLLASLAK